MAKNLPKLTEAHKIDVVLRLAGYDSPPTIARSLKEECGITIAASSIAFYDPTSCHGRRCPQRWATLFHETRAKIIAGLSDVGAANKMVRVRWLDQMARSEMAAKNSAEARALLKQVAEEMGEGVTHRHEHHGVFLYGDLSAAELNARIAAAAAELGLALVPLAAPAVTGPEEGVGEPQPAGDPVSG